MTDDKIKEMKNDALRKVEHHIDNQLHHILNVGIEIGKQMVKGKNEAKKPIVIIDKYACPVCSRDLVEQRAIGEDGWMDIHFKWCPDCGQRIDWGDEDGEYINRTRID